MKSPGSGRPRRAARAPSWWAAAVATALRTTLLAALLLAVLARDELGGAHTFDVERALKDIAEIARTPHSLNDPRSIGVRDYLRQTIAGIIDGSAAEFDDPAGNRTAAPAPASALFRAKGWLVYWEDSSLVVRVPGSGDDRRALLVQAHYDAVPMSRGAYDDGVGVAVCLEILRSLVRHPARHPVVINVDWGEESGLFGAELFARFHAWAEDVRAYINLEAGGVGGRAMVFRASHPALLAAYGRATLHPCASLVGNNALRLGAVRSDTDYSVYTTRYGVPGLDMAFTDGRSLYHTARDGPAAVTAASVRSMGDAALRTARLIADSPSILASIPRSARLPARPHAADSAVGARATIRAEPLAEPHAKPDNAVHDAVFYDVLSRLMVVRSYAAEMAINIATGILGIAALVALQYPFARPLPALVGAAYAYDHAGALDWAAAAPGERLALHLGQGGYVSGLAEAVCTLAKAYAAALLASLGATGLLLSLVAPRLAYTHPLLHLLLLAAAATAASAYVLAGWACRSRQPDIHAMVWYAWCLLRCLVLLAVVVPLNSIGVGVLYREQLYAWAAISAAALTALIDPHTGIGAAWRQSVLSLLDAAPAHHMLPPDSQRQRLSGRTSSSSDQSGGNSDADENSSVAGVGEHHAAASVDDHHVVAGALACIAALRLLVGVVAPLLFGLDVMLRQLFIFKGHLVDGMPPVLYTAIAALDMCTFVLFLAPYAVGMMADADKYWLISCTGRLLAFCLECLLAPLHGHGHRQPAHAPRGAASPRAISQISLHTTHPSEQRDSIDELLPSFYANHEADDHDDHNERIIVLDSGSRDSRADQHAASTGQAAAALPARKGEPPETVGLRMVYVCVGAWLTLWVATQLLMLGGEGYGETHSPMKVRVFQTSRVSAKCLSEDDGSRKAKCAYSKLTLSSPDSNGLARLLQAAVPGRVAHACYTQKVRDFYQCSLVDHEDYNNATSPWSPAAAININSIRHMQTPAAHGTLFTVTINFTAPETRTCFIDFGRHSGFSPQAYPNPYPVLPPPLSPSLPPIIERTVLPVIERAFFVDGVSGAAALVEEPIGNRDPVYSGRIFAHKREFDSQGLFSAVVQYSVPVENAARPAGVKVELSCYFDVVDRHVPLLASIIGASPAWAVFTPAGNALSTVTLVDVEI